MRKTLRQAVEDARIDRPRLTRADEHRILRDMDEIAMRSLEPTEEEWLDSFTDSWPDRDDLLA